MGERGEGEIRQDAALWAFVAEMEALKTERSGMEAENECRKDQGLAPAYDDAAFIEVSKKLYEIAFLLRRDI